MQMLEQTTLTPDYPSVYKKDAFRKAGVFFAFSEGFLFSAGNIAATSGNNIQRGG